MFIYGKNAVKAAINSRRLIKVVYLSQTLKDQQFLGFLRDNKINVEVLNNNVIEKRFNSNEKIIALVEDYQYVSLETMISRQKPQGQVLVMLDSLEDPHNLGAIMRSVDASGADGIIIAKNRSVGLNATVAKVSTGAIEYVDVVEVTNLVATLKRLKEVGFWVIGLEIDSTKDYHQQDYQGSIVLVIGSEGKGISRLVKENCDFLVKIPMQGHVNSLNASVSAGILLFEVMKQRLGMDGNK